MNPRHKSQLRRHVSRTVIHARLIGPFGATTRVVATMFLLGLASGVLAGCGKSSPSSSSTGQSTSTGSEIAQMSGPVRVETGSLDAALAGAHRSDDHRERDRHRHPKETLSFFGLEPTMHVIEIWPGGGWYTEVLAPILRDHGKLTVATTDPESEGYRGRFARDFAAKLAAAPGVYDQVDTVVLQPPEKLALGADSSADMVLTFRSTHSWMMDNTHEAAYRAFFAVLKPGGILGVVQHRDREGATPPIEQRRGYVPQAFVVELAKKVGFELVESSEINANPKDTKDHPDHVWSLPPSLRGKAEDKSKYIEIGESDRMTLKFRKP